MNSNSDHLPIRTIINTVCRFVSRAIKISGLHGVHVGLNIRGQSVILHDGECCHASRCGACTSAVFPIGCVAKPLVAIAGLRLSDLGMLRMDAPLTAYFQELNDQGKDVTCTNLLTHTGGFKGTLSREILIPGWTSGDLIGFLQRTPRLFTPGTVFNYDHLSLGLMCEIASRASGKSCFALVDEVIDGLAGTARRPGSHSANGFTRATSSNARSSQDNDIGLAWARSIHIDELLAVSRALATNRQSGTAEGLPISDLARKAMLHPSVSIPKPLFGTSGEHLPTGFSLALATFRRELVGYDGSLGNQAIGFRIHLQREISVVVGVQSGGQLYRRRILSGILACLELPPHAPHQVTHSEFDLRDIHGVYVGNDDTLIEVVHEGGTVDIHVMQAGAVKLSMHGVPRGDGSLAFPRSLMIDEPFFFRDPASGSPCLMIGLCAFKKMMDAQVQR